MVASIIYLATEQNEVGIRHKTSSGTNVATLYFSVVRTIIISSCQFKNSWASQLPLKEVFIGSRRYTLLYFSLDDSAKSIQMH